MNHLTKFFSFFLIVVILFACGQNKNNEALEYDLNTFPKYEKVLNSFFESGKAPRYPEKTGYYLSFAKKPDGWYVFDTKLGTDEQSNFRLFWSLKKKKFLEEAKEGTKIETERNIIQRYLNEDPSKKFDQNLFYGYPNWADDVIEVLDGQDKLIDEFWFTLADAYSYKANLSLGFYNRGFESKDKVEPNGKEAQKYFQKSLENYEKLKKQNSNFKVFIGDIGFKIANEYLNAFYSLDIAGFEQEAKSFLKPNLYEDFYISFAKNTLNSCRKNAILFTQGDLDTYTLLYVQNQMNYRKDIKIVNLGMLTANWYISYQIKKLGKLNITKQTYQNKLSDIVLLKQEKDKYDFQTIAKAFNNKDSKFIVELNNNQKFFQLDASKIQISEKMTLDYSNYPYLYKHKIALLDIVASFLNKQAICFASTTSIDFKGVFMYNFQTEGLISNITEDIKTDKENQTNIELTQDILDKFIAKGIDEKARKDDNKKRVILNYRNAFSGLVNAYLEEGQKEKALEIAEKSLQIFPDKYAKYDYYTLPLIRTFYENNKLEKANEIISKYLDYANEVLKKPKDKEDEISFYQYGTYYLLGILSDFEEGKKRYDEVEQVYKRLEFMVEQNRSK